MNARLKKVMLTQKGLESHEGIEQLIMELNHQMIQGISEEDLEIFLRTTRALRKNIVKKSEIQKWREQGRRMSMLKTLLKEVKEYKRASVVTPVFMILEVLMETLIPFLMASIIDEGVNAGNMQHIYKVGGIMVVAAAVGLFAGLAGGRFGAKASAGFAKNLREAMFNHIQRFFFCQYRSFQYGRTGNPYDN